MLLGLAGIITAIIGAIAGSSVRSSYFHAFRFMGRQLILAVSRVHNIVPHGLY